MDERTNIAAAFCRAHDCCRSGCGGCGQDIFGLLAKGEAGAPNPAELMSAKWQAVLSAAVVQLDMGMSDVENRHAFCKQNAPSGTSAELLFAKYCLNEAKSFAESFASIATPQEQPRTSQDMRRVHGILLYHHRRAQLCLETEVEGKAAATVHNPCSSEFWAETKRGWNSMSPEERQRYNSLALVSRVGLAGEVWEERKDSQALVPQQSKSHPLCGWTGLSSIAQDTSPDAHPTPLRLEHYTRILQGTSARKLAAVWDATLGGAISGTSLPDCVPMASCNKLQSGLTCPRIWQSQGRHYGKLEIAMQQLTACCQSIQRRKGPTGWGADQDRPLLACVGSVCGEVQLVRLGLMARASWQPNFQMVLECSSSVTSLSFPFTASCCVRPFVAKATQTSGELAEAGAPMIVHSADWLEAILCTEYGALEWQMQELEYECSCLTGGLAEPLGNLRVIGERGAPLNLLATKTRTVKSKAKATPKPFWSSILLALECEDDDHQERVVPATVLGADRERAAGESGMGDNDLFDADDSYLQQLSAPLQQRLAEAEEEAIINIADVNEVEEAPLTEQNRGSALDLAANERVVPTRQRL